MIDSKTVLGLLFEGADPAAALVRDGEIIAFAEEERFTREKHALNIFPSLAAQFCLDQAGLTLPEIDVIAVGWDAARFDDGRMAAYYANVLDGHDCGPHVARWQEKNRCRYTSTNLTRQINEHLFAHIPAGRQPEIRFIQHHYAHACSSFMLSGYDAAAVVTADGHGEADCTNIWVGDGDGIRLLQEWQLPQSLGWFYTKFTQWCGFRAHDGEGKLMGLAAYGTPNPLMIDKVAQVIQLTDDDRIYHLEPRFFLSEFSDAGPYTEEWLELFGPPRELESTESFTGAHNDLAYAVQDALEAAGAALIAQALKLTGQERVCTAGGTFMNCKMNGVLARQVGLSNYFVQPAAGDNGVALGAALAVAGGSGQRLRHLYTGPEFSDAAIVAALNDAGIDYHWADDVAAEAAALLADSKVLGWFQGRMEAGARALGNRSILANPLNPKMSDLVNTKVKFREPWRPFCPSAAVADGADYFDFTGALPFMIVACDARPGMKEKLPSVVHVDNSVRVQTVDAADNPRFHALISAFKACTGYGTVLNTSFNVKGEPIVCSPADAVDCFLRTAIDALVIGDFIAVKD
jgi:carbamoyltransferase